MIPQTRWAKTVDGAHIAYQDFGDGPVTLVVIHGWVTHLEVLWELPRFARLLRGLGERMRVIQFDKRGTGMSDRFDRPPDLEARMDDVRAVMDTAGSDRAAMFGWGDGGPPLAAFFAAANPDRTLALCIDPHIQVRRTFDYPFENTEEEFEGWVSEAMATWGEEEVAVDDPLADPEFARWCAKLFRFGATPGSMAALSRMWFDTDVRDILPTIQVPTLVLSMTEVDWASAEQAAYVAERIPGARIATVPGKDPFQRDDPEPLVSAIHSFLASAQLEEAAMDRHLATVLFTDIVGSTEKIASVGDRAWRDLVERHHAIVRAFIKRYRGAVMDTAGDGFFATFDGPARAIRCALAISETVKPLGIEVRSGVHTGEVERLEDKVGGIAVSLGARICALAEPSEVLASRTVRDLVAGSGLVFDDRGDHDLKGVPGTWHLFSVRDEPPNR